VEAGDDVLLEIDWQGAAQVRQLIPSTVGIFVLPPSLQVLKERLERRGQDSPAVIARRLEAAQAEMRHCGEFDYVIINQDFAVATDDVAAIVRASRLRRAPQLSRHGQLLQSLLAPRI
jgi:guanylate kinase